MVFFGFSCHEFYRYLYFSIGTVLISIVGISLFQKKRMPMWIPIVCFIGIVLYGWTQAIHEYFIHQAPSQRSSLVVEAYIKSFSSYIIGFAFYSLRVPEAWFPVTFDLIGGSHNYWHIFCAVGATYQYSNTLAYYELRNQCP